jgi:RNA polymerase sigma-70 factor (ECF subfamily)
MRGDPRSQRRSIAARRAHNPRLASTQDALASRTRGTGAEFGAGAGVESQVFLLALQHGATWATAEAWRRYAPLVNGILRRGLGPHTDVDDATQEVFLRLFRRIGTLRDATALRAFIVSVTVRVMKWQLRRRFIRRWVRLSSSGELPEVATPQLDVEGREALRRAYALLDRLKPLDRTIFVLRQTEQLSLPEIAQAVELSVSTVKRRLGRIGPRVRRLIEADPLLAVYLSQDGLGILEEVAGDE